MSNIKFVGIIILNYNNWEDTINCIESIEKHNTANIKYFVVDNGSTHTDVVHQLDMYFSKRFKDNYSGKITTDITDNKLKKINFIISDDNTGYAKGNNKGLSIAFQDEDVEDILILNNDVLFVEDIIPRLIEYRNKIDDCAFISPVLYKRNGIDLDYNCARTNITNWNLLITYLFWYQDFFSYISNYSHKTNVLLVSPELLRNDIIKIELPSGSCMFSSKELWKNMDGFDGDTFLYYEENILYKRIHGMGLNNYLIPSLKCIHLGAQSSKRIKSWFTINEQFKSSMYYLDRYGDLSLAQRIAFIICKKWFPIKIKLIKHLSR